MKIQSLVKIGASRQVAIPKRMHDQLGLSFGDYVEMEIEGSRIVLTPKVIADRYIEARIEEGLRDIVNGRVSKSFSSAKKLINSLHHEVEK